MPLLASRVGAELGAREFEATPRRLLAYAAVLGETARAAFDDTAPDFAALPQFCVVAEWPWASDPARMQGLGLEAGEAARAMHLGQDSIFHRPIRAGDRLRVSGRLAEVRAIRSGAVAITRIDTKDARTGESIVTSWSTALFPGVALAGDPCCADRPPLPAATPSAPGPEPEIQVPIPRELGHVYTECSGIWNPIHTERRVALAAGLTDIILHGTATWAIAGRELARAYGSGEWRRLLRLAGTFRAFVVPGTAIRLRHAGHSDAEGRTTIRFTVINAAGETAIADGVAEIED